MRRRLVSGIGGRAQRRSHPRSGRAVRAGLPVERLSPESGRVGFGDVPCSTTHGRASAASQLQLELSFAPADDEHALAELTRILKRIASRHGCR